MAADARSQRFRLGDQLSTEFGHNTCPLDEGIPHAGARPGSRLVGAEDPLSVAGKLALGLGQVSHVGHRGGPERLGRGSRLGLTEDRVAHVAIDLMRKADCASGWTTASRTKRVSVRPSS